MITFVCSLHALVHNSVTTAGEKLQKQSVDQIIDAILGYPNETKLQILAPVVKGRKGHYRELFEGILKDGFLRVRVDGEVRQIEKGMKVDRYKIHTIEIIIDRIVLKKEMRPRIADSVELALRFGGGVLIVNDGAKDQLFSQKSSCHECGISYEEPAPNSFSFNTPAGYCPTCEGLGELKSFDMRLIIPDENLSINREGLAPMGKPRPTWMFSQIHAVAKKYGFDFDTPIKLISKEARDVLFYGSRGEKLEVEYVHDTGRVQMYKHRFEGLLKMLDRWYEDTSSNQVRDWVESFMTTKPCDACHGGRLRKESLAIRLEDTKTNKLTNIHEVVQFSITQAKQFFEDLTLTSRQSEIAHQILREIRQRLIFLLNVGLNYLTLDRPARTLAGGEGQRIRLATQIGTQLVGVLYILDEPSIGLHQRDNIKLIESLKSLRDLGNTVIVVEHDKEMIQSADYVIDLGPRAGEHGGKVVVTGTPIQLKMNAVQNTGRRETRNGKKEESNKYELHSLTAAYLRGEHKIDIPEMRRHGNGKFSCHQRSDRQ